MNNFGENRVGASPCVRPGRTQGDAPTLFREANGRTQGDAPTLFRQPDHASTIDGNTICELDTEGHCITCSDEALSARVVRVDEQMGSASVTIGEALEEVDITLLDEVVEGDLLLVHGGVAIGNVGKDFALDEVSDA